MKARRPNSRSRSKTKGTLAVGSSAVLGNIEYTIGGMSGGRTVLHLWKNRKCMSLIMDNNALQKLITDLGYYLEATNVTDTRRSR
jgi:hypothetical protein